MEKKKIDVIKMLLKSIKGTTDSMKGHQGQHNNIESTINIIIEIVEGEKNAKP